MRFHRWFGPLLGAFAAVAGASTASAQQPPMPASGSAFADPSGAFYQVPGPGAVPGSFQQWPAISPYEMDYGRHVNEGGLWNYDNQSHEGMESHWKFRSEYNYIATKRPQGYVGNRAAPTYKHQLRNQLINQQAGAGGGANGGGQLQTLLNRFEGTNTYGRGFNWYDPIYGGEISSPTMDGLRISLDNLNPDGTGMELFGGWAIDDDTEYDSRKHDISPRRGQMPSITDIDTILQIVNARAPQLLINNGPIDVSQIPGPIGPYRSVTEALQSNLLNLRGIPLDDGTITVLPDGSTVGGASAVYDLDFKIKFSVEQYGAGLRWQTMPLIKNNWLRVNPNVGFRYTSIEENFSFFGRHSGWTYNSLGAAGGGNNNQTTVTDLLVHSLPNFFDDNRNGIVDEAGLIEDSLGGQAGGGGAQAGTSVFGPPTNALYPITSILHSRVRSYLAGPEIGMNYVIGGDSLRMGGRSTFALLANHERMTLSGDNIFVTTHIANLIQPTAADPRPNDFSDQKNSTHVSPLFEQNFYVEGPFLRYVPLLRRSSLFSKATVNVGYTLTYIGEFTRPDEDILWRGNPSAGLFPTIQKAERQTWKQDAFNIGLTWQW